MRPIRLRLLLPWIVLMGLLLAACAPAAPASEPAASQTTPPVPTQSQPDQPEPAQASASRPQLIEFYTDW